MTFDTPGSLEIIEKKVFSKIVKYKMEFGTQWFQIRPQICMKTKVEQLSLFEFDYTKFLGIQQHFQIQKNLDFSNFTFVI